MTSYQVTSVFPIMGDCGHRFDVSVVGLTASTDLACPVCGAVDRLTLEQVTEMQNAYGVALNKLRALEEAGSTPLTAD